MNNLGARRGEIFDTKPQLFCPGEKAPVLIVGEAGWAPVLILIDESGVENTMFTDDFKCDTT
jgi:hypothetical protein